MLGKLTGIQRWRKKHCVVQNRLRTGILINGPWHRPNVPTSIQLWINMAHFYSIFWTKHQKKMYASVPDALIVPVNSVPKYVIFNIISDPGDRSY